MAHGGLKPPGLACASAARWGVARSSEHPAPGDGWVIHSTAGWALQQWEESQECVADELLRTFFDLANVDYVEPDFLQAQTGWMQGAAGVGSFFLHLDGAEKGRAPLIQFPDSPWLG